jgi:hypothetical protein
MHFAVLNHALKMAEIPLPLNVFFSSSGLPPFNRFFHEIRNDRFQRFVRLAGSCPHPRAAVLRISFGGRRGGVRASAIPRK